MAPSPAINQDQGWQDYKPAAASVSSGGWQDYEPARPDFAMTPPAAAGAPPPKGTLPSTTPYLDKNLSELGEVGKGMRHSAFGLATAAPITIHRSLQNAGVVPSGDLFPGEKTIPQIWKEDVPNAVVGVLGDMVPEASESAARPQVGRSTIPSVEKSVESTGRLGRLAKVGVSRIPGVKLAAELRDAWNGPTPPPVKPPKPPIPETDGVQWGTGSGPLDLRGKAIPKPVSPNPRPIPAWKTSSTEGTEVPSILNRQPNAQAARPPRAIPKPVSSNPEAASPPIPEKPAPIPSTIPGSKADALETKGIQESIRDAAAREERELASQGASDRIKASTPGKSKGELTGTAKRPNPLGRRMDYPENALPKGVGTGKEVRGLRVPSSSKDLLDALKESVEQARQRKAASQ